jgi:DNA-binding transcriptional LysR family regulator
MLDLQHLKTFRVAAVTQSFTRAAAVLGCCQSTVTTHIMALERELGVCLFVRNRFSKTVVLTDQGRQALEYAGRLLALVNETKTVVQREPAAMAE